MNLPNTGSFTPSLRKDTCGITSILPNRNISIWVVPLPTETPDTYQHYTTPLVFSLVQETSTITKVTKEIFEVKSTIVTATTLQPIRTRSSTATLKCKNHTPNNQIPKLSIKLSPPPFTSLSLTPPTP